MLTVPGPLLKPVPTNSFQTLRITYDEIWIKNKNSCQTTEHYSEISLGPKLIVD